MVHMGGAVIAPAADTTSLCGETRDVLGPDPLAQNNNMDMPAAVRFYQIAQDSLVPLIVLSRHFVQACNMPRSLFDTLGNHGSALGGKLYTMFRSSMEDLWKAACVPCDEKSRSMP